MDNAARTNKHLAYSADRVCASAFRWGFCNRNCIPILSSFLWAYTLTATHSGKEERDHAIWGEVASVGRRLPFARVR